MADPPSPTDHPVPGSVDTGAPARPTIEALTGIRAVAAFWVVLFHLRATIPALLPETRFAQFLMTSGFMGVDVFFVLSGFIISYNYADRLFRLDRREYRAFLAARFARVYPVHLFALVLTAAVLAWAASEVGAWDPVYRATDFAANVLMLQALPGVVPWNVPSWSVSCEAAAYLAFPLVTATALRTGRRSALVAAVALTVLAAGAALLLGWGPSAEVAMYWVRIAAGFTAGCFLWRFWSGTVRPGPAWDAAVVVAVGAGVTVLYFVGGPASFTVMPLVALFVLGSAGATGVVRTVLASRVLQWGGKISYSLYLVHVPVFYALVIARPPRVFAGHSLVVRAGVVLAYVGAMIVAAAITHRLVEEPARRWLRRRTVERPPTPAEPAVARSDDGLGRALAEDTAGRPSA